MAGTKSNPDFSGDIKPFFSIKSAKELEEHINKLVEAAYKQAELKYTIEINRIKNIYTEIWKEYCKFSQVLGAFGQFVVEKGKEWGELDSNGNPTSYKTICPKCGTIHESRIEKMKEFNSDVNNPNIK